MSEPTSARLLDPRLMVKLNPALMPPRIRYQKKSEAELKKMQPLDELPEVLIPRAIPSVIRIPPLLRRGYPLTRDVFRQFIENDHRFEEVPVPGDEHHVGGLIAVEITLQRRIGWPVTCHHVYGLPVEEEEAVMFEVGNSYNVKRCAPPEVEEKLRRELHMEGSPKWYLDYEKSYWDWKVVLGMR
ncbi:hypothetical protein FPV67DRAFT_1506310 [Lyophyllum atratum]|nr:hypothetical protein FPV67DRAFT_1506310 [Lyophyllum atratum]